MDRNVVAAALDSGVLSSARLFDLDKPGRKASAKWLTRLFSRLVTEAIKPDVVLELGAFSAEFSRRNRAALPGAVWHAFEATPATYHRFADQVTQAGVQWHHLALGDRVGTCEFNVVRELRGAAVSPTFGGNSLLTGRAGQDWETVPVRMVTVDHFMQQYGLQGACSALWMDVEGCGYEVLTGAADTLRNTVAVYIEVETNELWPGQHTYKDVLFLLLDAGFVPVARDFEYPAQHNVIFLRDAMLYNHPVRLVLERAFSAQARRRTVKAQSVDSAPDIGNTP